MIPTKKEATHSLSPIVAVFAVVSAHSLLAQAAPTTLADETVQVNEPRVRSLLSKPNGLADAAQQVGHLEAYIYVAAATSKDLATLAATSDVVVLCRVLQQVASIDNTTNIVTTRVSLRVDEALKGTPPENIDINVPGGRVVFGNGIVADVWSTETKGLGNGLDVLLFLQNGADGDTFVPNNGMEGLFWVNFQDGMVNSFTRYEAHPHLVKATALTLAALRKQFFPGATIH